MSPVPPKYHYDGKLNTIMTTLNTIMMVNICQKYIKDIQQELRSSIVDLFFVIGGWDY